MSGSIIKNGMYDNGRSFPQFYRERILDLHHEEFTQRNVSDTVRVSVGYVSIVVKNYENNNISFPRMRKLPDRHVVTKDVIEYIESETQYVHKGDSTTAITGWSVTTQPFTIPKCNKKVYSE